MVLNTEAEQQALAPLVACHTWIGLHRDLSNTSRWLWVDGSNTDYTNWYKGEPNGAVGTDDCVLLARYNPPSSYSSKWVNWRCTSSFNYVCKISGKIFLYKQLD